MVSLWDNQLLVELCNTGFSLFRSSDFIAGSIPITLCPVSVSYLFVYLFIYLFMERSP